MSIFAANKVGDELEIGRDSMIVKYWLSWLVSTVRNFYDWQ